MRFKGHTTTTFLFGKKANLIPLLFGVPHIIIVERSQAVIVAREIKRAGEIFSQTKHGSESCNRSKPLAIVLLLLLLFYEAQNTDF